MYTSPLLINESPLQVLPSLAKKIGLNEALFLQQLHEQLKFPKKTYEDRRWIYNTFEEWEIKLPFWSKKTIKRIVKKLKDSGIIIVKKLSINRSDRTNWYSIDYKELKLLLSEQLETILS